jgi:hypothetical protein
MSLHCKSRLQFVPVNIPALSLPVCAYKLANARLTFLLYLDRPFVLLAALTHLRRFIDSAATLQLLQQFAVEQHWHVPVFVKIDAGNKRAGVPDVDAFDLVQAVHALGEGHAAGVRLLGIYSHSGHAYTCTCLAEAQACAAEECSRMSQLCRRLEAAGVQVPIVSIGSVCCINVPAQLPCIDTCLQTPTASVLADVKGARQGWDVHPG